MFNVTLIAADWWSWLIPLVFIVIYLVNHMLAGAKLGPGKQRDAQQRRRPPAGERPLRPGQAQPGGQAQPRGQAQQQGGQRQLNAEIEQFLKRANERRMEKARSEAQPARPTRPTPKQPLAAPPPPLREQPLEIEPLEQHDFDLVEESVKKHLGNRGFEQRAEHLGDDVEHADEEMDQHLKKVFDHKLGSLAQLASDDPNAPRDIESPIARADPQASAKALAGLLANQQNLRQAILLKEILERPVDRW